MKLIPFQYTNEYDSQSVVHVNPAYVVSLRPHTKTKTVINLVTGQVSVDGTIEVVSRELCGDDNGAPVITTVEQQHDIQSG